MKSKKEDSEFIPYEQALALKELGFDEKCITAYETHYPNLIYAEALFVNANFNNKSEYFNLCSRPLYQQAFRWFDNNSEFQGFITPSIKENHFDWVITHDGDEWCQCDQYYQLREEAELACLKKLIEILKSLI